tara:strand:+ start:49 stop:540 length:492 start_codon:yes stop_codon:yes gene_type:complete
LALGVTPCGLLESGGGVSETGGSREEVAHLPDADGFGGAGLEMTERGNFVGDAGGDHRLNAPVDAVVQGLSLKHQDHTSNIGGGPGKGSTERGLRLASEETDFEGSLDIARIGEGNVVASSGVEPEEFGDFVSKGLGLESGSKGRIGRRQFGESVGEGLDVEA